MEEFNKDRSIIESGCTLTGSDIEFVKESNNYQGKDCVSFMLLKDVFPIWLAKHERFLGVTFYKKGGCQYKDGSRIEYFRCACSGNKEEKNRHAGGRTGTVWTIWKVSKKIDCKSRINFHYKARSLPSNKVVEVVEVKYFYQHNHQFATNKVAHLPLSNAMKRLIRAEVENGSRNRDIKVKLSKSSEQVAADNTQGLRPTCNDILMADDIQYIKHKVLLADVKKHDDRVISTQCWMDDIAREQGFSYHDRNDGAYCFSSKWQMEKLLAHGDVICIDGTHEPFGYVFSFTTVTVAIWCLFPSNVFVLFYEVGRTRSCSHWSQDKIRKATVYLSPSVYPDWQKRWFSSIGSSYSWHISRRTTTRITHRKSF